MKDYYSKEEIKAILEELKNKSDFLRILKRLLHQKQPEYRVDFDIVVFYLQNKVEDVFDRILRCYTRPKQKDEYLYEHEIMKEIAVSKDSETIRAEIIFNLGFAEKKSLVYKTFKISRQTRQVIDKLNEIRNAVAHRYSEEDKRFFYNHKNILTDYKALRGFFEDCLTGVNEIFNLDTKLLDAVDKAEKGLG